MKSSKKSINSTSVYKNHWSQQPIQSQIQLFNQLYHTQQKSLSEMAAVLETNISALRRFAIKNNICLRTKSENQKLVLANNKASHPTKGTKRPEDIKNKIAARKAKYWENISEEDKNAFIEKAKDNWNNLSQESRDKINHAAHVAIRKAAEDGSRLENYIKDSLSSKYTVESHIDKILKNEKLEIDLFLPECNIVIEIDGPSHFLPIWGDEALAKTQKADSEKNGLLVFGGYYVIRLAQMVKHLSNFYMKKCLDKLSSIIQDIVTDKPSQKLFYIRIGKNDA